MRSIADQGLQHVAGLAKLVRTENQHQLHKWGAQNRTPAKWMLYLCEEVGELAEAIAQFEYRDGQKDDVVREATQVATLALKIAEMYCWTPSNTKEAQTCCPTQHSIHTPSNCRL